MTTTATTSTSNNGSRDEINPQLADPSLVAKVCTSSLWKQSAAIVAAALNMWCEVKNGFARRSVSFWNPCSMKSKPPGFVVSPFNAWSSVRAAKYVIFTKHPTAQIAPVYISSILITVFPIRSVWFSLNEPDTVFSRSDRRMLFSSRADQSVPQLVSQAGHRTCCPDHRYSVRSKVDESLLRGFPSPQLDTFHG